MRTLALGRVAAGAISIGTISIAAALLPAAPAHADPTPTCEGHPATIVGTRRQTVVGTSGPDVIVAHRPRRVDAGDGDDIVCVLGGIASIDLGAGADTFVSTRAGGYRIDTGDGEDQSLGRPPAHDSVTTAEGTTRVLSGYAGLADDDTIELGGWQDTLVLAGVPTGRFEAADYDPIPEQPDLDQLRLVDPVPSAWQVDESAGTVRVDDGPVATLAGWETLHLDDLTWSSFDYVGTSGRDALLATGPLVGPGPITADLRGRQDTALLSPRLTGSVAGGSGHDDVTVRGERHGPLEGDLRLPLHGRWTLDGRPGVRLTGFEWGGAVSVRHATVLGTAAANVLELRSCTGEVDGRRGDDQVFLEEVRRCSPRDGAFVARGGPGQDRLQGSGVGDLLVGGPGVDEADGEGGPDQCSAERSYC